MRLGSQLTSGCSRVERTLLCSVASTTSICMQCQPWVHYSNIIILILYYYNRTYFEPKLCSSKWWSYVTKRKTKQSPFTHIKKSLLIDKSRFEKKTRRNIRRHCIYTLCFATLQLPPPWDESDVSFKQLSKKKARDKKKSHMYFTSEQERKSLREVCYVLNYALLLLTINTNLQHLRKWSRAHTEKKKNRRLNSKQWHHVQLCVFLFCIFFFSGYRLNFDWANSQ